MDRQPAMPSVDKGAGLRMTTRWDPRRIQAGRSGVETSRPCLSRRRACEEGAHGIQPYCVVFISLRKDKSPNFDDMILNDPPKRAVLFIQRVPPPYNWRSLRTPSAS